MSTSLITGANKGIGRETARRLVEAGQDVWIAARNPAARKAAADEVRARFVQLDVTDDASVAAAVQTVRKAGTGLDILVNNAGIAAATNAPQETTADDLAEVYDANVFGIVRVTNAFLPLLEGRPPRSSSTSRAGWGR